MKEINRIYDEQVSINALYMALILAYVLIVWLQFLFPSNANPIVLTILGFLAFAFYASRLVKAKRLIKALKMGRDGEKVVGQELDELRVLGYGILHDVLGPNFNLDHVIFSKHGIYVVETKTLSKPFRGAVEITFLGNEIVANGHKLERDPIVQVKAAANWLRKFLKGSTGKKYPVKGIVVFPGWFVHPMSPSLKEEAWVLNPKALASFISNEPARLKDDEVAMAVFHLARYVRTTNT